MTGSRLQHVEREGERRQQQDIKRTLRQKRQRNKSLWRASEVSRWVRLRGRTG